MRGRVASTLMVAEMPRVDHAQNDDCAALVAIENLMALNGVPANAIGVHESESRELPQATKCLVQHRLVRIQDVAASCIQGVLQDMVDVLPRRGRELKFST